MDLEIYTEVSGTRQRLDPLVEAVNFRVAHEALTNVSLHARTYRASLHLDFGTSEEPRSKLRGIFKGKSHMGTAAPKPPLAIQSGFAALRPWGVCASTAWYRC